MIFEKMAYKPPTSFKSTLSAISKVFKMFNQPTPLEYISKMKNLQEDMEAEMKKRSYLNEKILTWLILLKLIIY